MAPALRTALGFGVSSCRCRCAREQGGQGQLRSGRSGSPSVHRGQDRPGPVRGSQRPALPPKLRAEGAPHGGGRAPASHDTQAGPASCSGEAHGSLQSRCSDLRPPALAMGGPARELFCPSGLHGAPPGSQVPCGLPGCSSPTFWQAGPARDLQTAASPSGAEDARRGLPAGPDVARIPRRRQALPAGWLCRRQSQTPEEMEGGQALGGVWQSWRAPGARLLPHPCSEGLLQTGRGV